MRTFVLIRIGKTNSAHASKCIYIYLQYSFRELSLVDELRGCYFAAKIRFKTILWGDFLEYLIKFRKYFYEIIENLEKELLKYTNFRENRVHTVRGKVTRRENCTTRVKCPWYDIDYCQLCRYLTALHALLHNNIYEYNKYLD